MKRTTLRSKTALRGSGFKRKPQAPLKRSPLKKKVLETPQQILDSLFSRYIRRLHANPAGYVKCITCQRVFHWTIIQAGHFVPRGQLGTRYEETNVWPQCEECNCFRGGRADEFELFIIRCYGPRYPELLRQKGQIVAHNFPYGSLIATYTEKLTELVGVQGREIHY